MKIFRSFKKIDDINFKKKKKLWFWRKFFLEMIKDKDKIFLKEKKF